MAAISTTSPPAKRIKIDQSGTTTEDDTIPYHNVFKSSPITPFKLLSAPMIKLTTSNKDQKRCSVYIHHELLITSSTYFRDQLYDSTTKLPLTEYVLTDTSTFAMGALVDHLYGVNIDAGRFKTDTGYTESYRLAERLKIRPLQNCIMDVIRLRHRLQVGLASPRHLSSLISKGLSKNMLSDFITKRLVWKIMTNDVMAKQWAQDSAICNNSKLMELIGANVLLYVAEPWEDPILIEEGCHFHNHDNGGKCEAGSTSEISKEEQ